MASLAPISDANRGNASRFPSTRAATITTPIPIVSAPIATLSSGASRRSSPMLRPVRTALTARAPTTASRGNVTQGSLTTSYAPTRMSATAIVSNITVNRGRDASRESRLNRRLAAPISATSTASTAPATLRAHANAASSRPLTSVARRKTSANHAAHQNFLRRCAHSDRLAA